MQGENNLGKLRRVLEAKELDALVILDPGFASWALGAPRSIFGGGGIAVLFDDSGVSVVTHLLEFWRISDKLQGVEVYVYTRRADDEVVEPGRIVGPNLKDALVRLLGEGKRVGCDRSACTQLQGVKGVEALDVTSDLWSLRMVKEDWELRRMVEALDIAERALRKTMAMLSEGITELEVAGEHERILRIYGSETHAFATHGSLTIVAFGANTAYPHWDPSDRRLTGNEPVLIDTGAVKRGYCSDVTRVTWYPAGSGPREWRELVERVVAAVGEAIDRVEPGIEASVVDEVARRALGPYAKWFIHSTGHGIGVEVHEPPRVAPGEKTRLEKGMVFTIEPGVYLRGRFGVRIEQMVVVDSRGARVLNKLPMTLE
ncbi:peptidase M24 [Pyrolobus fumarii 1A]|uniref:Peptidase M24 n=1 Tax=Pyrolobus fumarii (strain DSM 11204 / 1A) TaxID=694429 RepID=G0EDY2_PYRF1|nr:Xaa-Pro peptidase family protein [Pyrolobus fumarii]AEM37898.1 peptidase M24 [Pyrolobus fumarii 1A]